MAVIAAYLLYISKWSLYCNSLDLTSKDRDSSPSVILQGEPSRPFYIYLITFGTQWTPRCPIPTHAHRHETIWAHHSFLSISCLNPPFFPWDSRDESSSDHFCSVTMFLWILCYRSLKFCERVYADGAVVTYDALLGGTKDLVI